MRKIKKILLEFCLFFVFYNGIAQPLPISTNYTLNKYSLSPACAGLHNNFKAVMAYRQNWMGMQGAPENTMVFIDGSIFDNAGYGFNLMTEKTGIFRDLSIGGTYAYHVLIDKNQYLSFGLTAGYYKNDIDFGQIKIYDSSDPVIEKGQYSSASTFNGSFGVSYLNGNLNTGITVNNLLKNELLNNGIIYPSYRQYKAYFSYHYIFNQFNSIEPFLVLYKNSKTGINYDFAAVYRYNNQFWGGLIYRNGFNISIVAGLNLYGSFFINYCYEFSPWVLLGSSIGSHEISIGFVVDKDQRFSIDYIKAKRRHFKNTIKQIFK